MIVTERRWLDVPYREKDIAKARGARWDPEARRWYAPPDADLVRYAPWLPVPVDGETVNVRVAVLTEPCPRCGRSRSAVLGMLVPVWAGADLVGLPTVAGDEVLVDVDDCGPLLAALVPAEGWASRNIALVRARGGEFIDTCLHCGGHWAAYDLVEAMAELDAIGVEVNELPSLTVDAPLAALRWLAAAQGDAWGGDEEP